MSRSCPLCNTQQKNILRTMHYTLFDDSALPAETEIARCLGCGFIYASSDSGPEDYLAHYQNNSIYSAPQRLRPGTTPLSHGPLADRANRFLPKIPAHGTIVDIGAGSGDLLATTGLLRPDIRRIAIDPDPRCIDILRTQGIDAWKGTLDHLPAALQQQADAVILSHVLEHLWHPLEGIRQAASLLRENGLLYIETPDRLGYEDNPNVPFYYFDPEHINHFSLSDLSSTGTSIGMHSIAHERTTLQLAEGISYPICWSILSREHTGISSTPKTVTQDHAVEAYIRKEDGRLRSWLKQAREALASAKTTNGIVIWGTGSQAQRMMAENLFVDMSVLAFLDSDPSKQGRTMAGYPVQAPAKGLANNRDDVLIVILAAHAAAQSIAHLLTQQHPHRRFIQFD